MKDGIRNWPTHFDISYSLYREKNHRSSNKDRQNQRTRGISFYARYHRTLNLSEVRGCPEVTGLREYCYPFFHHNQYKYNMAEANKPSDTSPFADDKASHGVSSSVPLTYQAFKEEFMKAIIAGKDTNICFDNFPGYLSETTKNDLIEATSLYLTKKEHRLPMTFLPTCSRVLLSGPAGSDIYQEMVVKALACFFDSKLLIFDSSEIPTDLSNMDEELLKEGLRPKHKFVPFRIGDRVIYSRVSQNSEGPSYGDRGIIMSAFKEGGLTKLGVQFDKPIPGATNLGGLSKEDHGFVCSGGDVASEILVQKDMKKLIVNFVLDALFEVVRSEGKNRPTILFIKDYENSIINNSRFCAALRRKLNTLVGSIAVIYSHTYDKQDEKKKDIEVISELFLMKVNVETPQDKTFLIDWEDKLKRDAQMLKAKTNLKHIRTALSKKHWDCDDIETICTNYQGSITRETAHNFVTQAYTHHAVNNFETCVRGEKLVISSKSLDYVLNKLKGTQDTSNGNQNKTPNIQSKLRDTHSKSDENQEKSESSKKPLKDSVAEDEFEKKLLENVISPGEIGVTFEDIGALENVKESLRELVTLPLQRPELFSRGQLTKPCKGFLLFGPPGTGKTMLAKAVATESGAIFLNISMSTITSKWFGEDVKYIKAIFTLASKISPAVIFIDEVDSLLGQRKTGESEAMRGIKNEFMSCWDGLCTKDQERVMVLAATNRPFDLDEAVIRRMPRRIMVNLPDATNRAKILQKILEKEDLAPNVDLDEIARITEGYSGSDLKELCSTAGFCPIKEQMKKEKEKSLKEKLPQSSNEDTDMDVDLRPITMDDMLYAAKEASASVSSKGQSMTELLRWNDLYGEGASKEKKTHTYFI